MESAYIFGQVGNLGAFLGQGWSVEEDYAWAIGSESRLTLPLPSDDKPYLLRFNLHPLVNPGARDAQRLVILAGAEVLGRFEVTQHGRIELLLPVHLTVGRDHIDLTLVHPDAMRPRDFLDSQDSRWLALCFHSADLVHEDAGATPGTAPHADLPVGIVAGNYTALQLARLAAALPSLRGHIGVHYIDTDQSHLDTAHTRPPSAVESARLCWLQVDTGRRPHVAALLAALPRDCEIRRFGVPELTAFWPFLSTDPRAVREPGRYIPARYRFGDRIAAGLTRYAMADDLLYTIYEGMTEKEMPNLDALLAVDVMNWKRLDARCDVKLAPYLEQAVRTERPFAAPTIPGGDLIRALATRLLDTPVLHAQAPQADVLAELGTLMEGYIGRREELPIHPLVGRHFQPAWWAPAQTYRWFGNRFSFKDYTLDYIKWTQWRP